MVFVAPTSETNTAFDIPRMAYSRAVKSGLWRYTRLSESRDYDIKSIPKRSMSQSTYKRLGLYAHIPKTTYQSMLDDLENQKNYKARPERPMINLESLSLPSFNRELGQTERGSGAILPRFPEGFEQHHLETTMRADYQIPYPYCQLQEKSKSDLSDCYRQATSQFTDVTGPKRQGHNKWVDETGVYFNSHLKRQIVRDHKLIGMVTNKYDDDVDFDLIDVHGNSIRSHRRKPHLYTPKDYQEDWSNNALFPGNTTLMESMAYEQPKKQPHEVERIKAERLAGQFKKETPFYNGNEKLCNPCPASYKQQCTAPHTSPMKMQQSTPIIANTAHQYANLELQNSNAGQKQYAPISQQNSNTGHEKYAAISQQNSNAGHEKYAPISQQNSNVGHEQSVNTGEQCPVLGQEQYSNIVQLQRSINDTAARSCESAGQLQYIDAEQTNQSISPFQQNCSNTEQLPRSVGSEGWQHPGTYASQLALGASNARQEPNFNLGPSSLGKIKKAVRFSGID